MSETPLESAQRGHCNAGRGPFEVEPGRAVELLRVNGDVSKGRTHVLTVAVYDEDDKPVPTVLPQGASDTVGVPLTGIVRYGQDGTMPSNVEIDVKHGTSFVVPAGFAGFSIRNDATPGETVIGEDTYTVEDKTRKVGAWIVEGTTSNIYDATRTIQNVEVVAAGGGAGSLTRIPKQAVGVALMIDLVENPNDKTIEFFDDFGNRVAQVPSFLALTPFANIPNQASFVRFFNVNFTQSDRHSFVFSLAL